MSAERPKSEISKVVDAAKLLGFLEPGAYQLELWNLESSEVTTSRQCIVMKGS